MDNCHADDNLARIKPNRRNAAYDNDPATSTGGGDRAWPSGLEPSANLPGAADQDHRAVAGWRHHRHAGAHGGAETVGEMGPAGDRRQQARRRRQYRRRGGGQGRARRLHVAVHLSGAAYRQPDALQRARLRSRALRADLARCRRAAGAGGAAEGGGDHRAATDRACQGASGPAQFRLAGLRHIGTSGRRAVQIDGGDRHRPRPLQGQRAGAHRSASAAAST